MKEISTYEACKRLQAAGLFDLAQNAEYWSVRADYLTIYEYILANYPDRPYGYQKATAKALSFKRLGGGYCDILDANDVKRALRVMESSVYI